MRSLLIGDLGTPELLIILVIVILVFGASKLPELARGSGRALRIFKAETKGLNDDDDDEDDVKPATTAPNDLDCARSKTLDPSYTPPHVYNTN